MLMAIDDKQRLPEGKLWHEFDLERPRILGALLDAAAHGLRMLPRVHLDRLPRMADFATWVTACETALWPAGTFARAYEANRKAAIEAVIDADPVAARVRDIIAGQRTWTGTAADLLRAGADHKDGLSSTGWPRNPRVLAGRLRRAQTFLRAAGVEIIFSREGRAGSRVIRIRATLEKYRRHRQQCPRR